VTLILFKKGGRPLDEAIRLFGGAAWARLGKGFAGGSQGPGLTPSSAG
jgi:hypothetical protein